MMEGRFSSLAIPKQSIYRFRKANVALFNQLIQKGFNREEEEKLSLKQTDS